jgi:hypothetical protein
MISDTEIKINGMNALVNGIGLVEAERFVSLIQREKFDYTKWRQKLFEGLSGEELSKKAMDYIKMGEKNL